MDLFLGILLLITGGIGLVVLGALTIISNGKDGNYDE